MRRRTPWILLAAIYLLGPIQSMSQNNKKLAENNGFKTYKMGSKYQKVYGLKSKQPDGSEVVVIDYTRDKIGDIPVKTIDLYYVRDSLAKIIVHFESHYSVKLLEACMGSFGNASKNLSDNEATQKEKPSDNPKSSNYTDRHVWEAAKLSMEYFYTYPKLQGDAYARRDLYLNYSVKDYSQRLARIDKGKYSPKDF
jgi:hypothetical protein